MKKVKTKGKKEQKHGLNFNAREWREIERERAKKGRKLAFCVKKPNDILSNVI